jgi:Ca2+-binding RTX toxin-like protein
MATTVSNSLELRDAIQNATALNPDILLNDSINYSVTTLAKFPCFDPLQRYDGYTINTTNPSLDRTAVIVNDTRIYQENIDGPYAPSSISNLTLRYNSATANNTAIFRDTIGTYNLNNVDIIGEHGGWAGNGRTYMALNQSNGYTSTQDVDLMIAGSHIAVTGQVGFDPVNNTGNTSAFLLSWNNKGDISISNNKKDDGNGFDESGYKSSFHFATLYPKPDMSTPPPTSPLLGNYSIIGTDFYRSDSATQKVRDRGNRLESVKAYLSDNSFSDGSYLALYGDVSQITLDAMVGTNTFNTIVGGSGIEFHQTASNGAVLSGTPSITGAQFSGEGLAIKYVNSTANSVYNLSGSNTVKLGVLANQSISHFYAGGQGNDSILGTAAPDWISGDTGNDTIAAGAGNDIIIGGAGDDTLTGGAGNDRFTYYSPSEGIDNITDWSRITSPANNDRLAFSGSGFGITPGSTLVAGTNFNTALSGTVPQFIWDSGTRTLSYDRDGVGGLFPTQTILTLGGTTALTAAMIDIF